MLSNRQNGCVGNYNAQRTSSIHSSDTGPDSFSNGVHV